MKRPFRSLLHGLFEAIAIVTPRNVPLPVPSWPIPATPTSALTRGVRRAAAGEWDTGSARPPPGGLGANPSAVSWSLSLCRCPGDLSWKATGGLFAPRPWAAGGPERVESGGWASDPVPPAAPSLVPPPPPDAPAQRMQPSPLRRPQGPRPLSAVDLLLLGTTRSGLHTPDPFDAPEHAFLSPPPPTDASEVWGRIPYSFTPDRMTRADCFPAPARLRRPPA